MPAGGILITGGVLAGLFVGRQFSQSKVVRAHDGSLGQEDGPLDRILELSDVARPVVTLEQLLCRGVDALDLLVELSGEASSEELASCGMSSLRSRSGGMSSETKLSR